MTADQRVGMAAMFLGACLAVGATLMIYVPLGLLVAGTLCVVLGTAVLRGSKR